MAFYNLRNKSFPGMFNLNATGNVNKDFWSNTTGPIKDSQCIATIDGGCLDSDYDFHPWSEVDQTDGSENGGTQTPYYPQQQTSTTSSGGGLFGWLGQVFTPDRVGQILVGQLGQVPTPSPSAPYVPPRTGGGTTQPNPQNPAQPTTASNKWIYTGLIGLGIATIGTILYLVLRPKKAA